MDVRQLRHFAAVAETLHFGRAAARLNMTQPPLSQSIMALERELGAALFVRTKRSVALTPFGAQWLVEVRAVLGDLAALPDIAKRLRDGEAGRLELSFVSTADYSVLPTLVRRYAGLYPEVEIALTEATSEVQITALLEGVGHAGIIIPPARGGLPEALRYRRLLSEELVAAVPESWVEAGRLPLTAGRLDPAVVVQAPLIIFPRRSAPAFHDLITGYFTAHGGAARIVQEAIQMQTIISLVSAGMGVALVPASLRNLARTGVRYLDLAGAAPSLETGVVWRRDDLTPTLGRFLEVAFDGVGGLPTC
ncbi:MAG: LysR family transcriptional regulator [Alphaproteobacteria bacterium]|nr:LysR family transcriptional regulator [Alphaproteobacteria bacterium]MBU1513320.1 LysR family transcriptional regulator [Alphaproteobacteria bacterium]MBU2096312.1 LysR family transcriptional regulator [Alphaproteobacteria bacterium]MBU2154035.1 LysR family transcriptional regulator [Alphaproteobacteria bacterium]MBU2306929.1 LysR family transcriptional regulator [Alphaproteobacteria bacterium]